MTDRTREQEIGERNFYEMKAAYENRGLVIREMALERDVISTRLAQAEQKLDRLVVERDEAVNRLRYVITVLEDESAETPCVCGSEDPASPRHGYSHLESCPAHPC